MPYITHEQKVALRRRDAENPGELNYKLTKLVLKYLDTLGESYTTINGAVGALECCKLELYRRLAVPYEDKKIVANGDVYP